MQIFLANMKLDLEEENHAPSEQEAENQRSGRKTHVTSFSLLLEIASICKKENSKNTFILCWAVVQCMFSFHINIIKSEEELGVVPTGKMR